MEQLKHRKPKHSNISRALL